MSHFYKTVKSPVGELKLITSDKGLVALLWPNSKNPIIKLLHLDDIAQNDSHLLLLKAEQQLNEYFLKKRKKFDLQLDFECSAFKQSVLTVLLTINYGQTCTYQQIARQIGKPNALRAVGMANSQNPISIIIPCHRVIGSNGRLTGFAGGLKVKEYLLNLESANN